MSNRFLLIAIVCTISLFGCDQNNSDESISVVPVQIRDSGKNIYVTAMQTGDAVNQVDNKMDNNLNLLFDNKTDELWIAEKSGCNLTIQITLDKPRYIENIRLYLASSNNNYYLDPKRITLSAHKDRLVDDPIFGNHLEKNIEKQNAMKIVTFSFADGTSMGVFPVTTILVSVRECFQVSEINRIAFSEIELNWSKKPVYSPKNSISQIKKKYAATRNGWHVPRSNYSDLISEQDVVLADLAFYALNGSVEAEELFSAYSPSGAMSGEEFIYLKDWLEMTKQGR